MWWDARRSCSAPPPCRPCAGDSAPAHTDGEFKFSSPPTETNQPSSANTVRDPPGLSLPTMPSTRFLHSLQSIPATDWDALHDGQNPFVSHAFLSGLEQHGCLREDWGWQPRHCTLWEGERLIGAIPGYLKTNSHGEFVFDHAWANAMPGMAATTTRSGWRGAVLAGHRAAPAGRHDSDRAALLSVLRDALPALEVSSAHINFHTAADEALFGDGCCAGCAVPVAEPRRVGNVRAVPRRDGPQAPQEHPPGTEGHPPGHHLPRGARRRGQPRRPAGDVPLLPADLPGIRQCPGADRALPAPSGDLARAWAGAVPGRAGRPADCRRTLPAGSTVWRYWGGATLPACISKPVTTRASSTACAKA